VVAARGLAVVTDDGALLAAIDEAIGAFGARRKSATEKRSAAAIRARPAS